MGKPSISMGHLYHGYGSHNQRVAVFDPSAPKDTAVAVHPEIHSFSAKNLLSRRHQQQERLGEGLRKTVLQKPTTYSLVMADIAIENGH